ncbi:MAG: hypothetical protein LQ342_002302 [Letrouitia transgressa]|nr:MAG: hypothetical protein LQ342_002302 [Letrouitia transgressa]
MAAVKRKDPPSTKAHHDAYSKKLKQNGAQVKKERKTAYTNVEVETDSDPIIESDTDDLGQSGDDDGVSWPSADSQEEEEQEEKKAIDKKEALKNVISSRPPAKPSMPKEEASNSTHPKLSSSQEAHAKQKTLAYERRAAKPNADAIARTKKLWERLRRKSHVPPAERKKLIAELFSIISGHIKDFVLKHDSVRVIQTALKYANVEQRRMIARELKGEYKVLVESRYAKFLVGKLMSFGDAKIRDMIVPEFYGQVRRMIRHPEAGWILDDVYRGAATPAQKTRLLREWYGAEFALFDDAEGGADLVQILEKNPEKRKPIMRSLWELLNQLVQKKATGYTMLHDAMLQYYLNTDPGSDEATEFLELLKGDEEGDLLKNLAFTRSGARVVALALAYSNAKDRKLLRVYKSVIQQLAYDPYGHQILLAAYDLVDDTVQTSKLIFPELVSQPAGFDTTTPQSLLAMLNDRNARIPLLYLLSPSPSRSLLPEADLSLVNELRAIRPLTSKKDPLVRRTELLTHLLEPLVSLITSHASELVISAFGCHAITEILLSQISAASSTFDKRPSLQALASMTSSSQPDELRSHMLSSPFVGRMLKSLVQGGRFNPQTRTVETVEPPLGFGDVLFEAMKKEDDVLDWAASSNSFIVVAMMEKEGFKGKQELKEMLRKGRGRLEEETEGRNKGAEILLDMLG